MSLLENLTEAARLVDETLSKIEPSVAEAYKPARAILAAMIARELTKQVTDLVKPWHP